MTRVMITGGRGYTNEARVYQILDAAIIRLEMTELIVGDCPTGLDALGKKWARERGFAVREFKANWDDLTAPGARIKKRRDGSEYNANAGPDRNRAMVVQGKPHHGLAFKGNDGTRDAVRHLRAAGIEPHFIDWNG